MAKSKHQRMSFEALKLVASRFKAMSEPLRLQILQELENGEMSVSDIVAAVETTQPNVSKHLKQLQDVGILSRRQEGNIAYYSIADKTIFEICDIICANIRERLSEQTLALGKPVRRRFTN